MANAADFDCIDIRVMDEEDSVVTNTQPEFFHPLESLYVTDPKLCEAM